MKRTAKLLMVLSALVVLLAPLTVAHVIAQQYFIEYPVPTAGASPFEITAGADGNLWFSERFEAAVGRITPAGSVTEFSIPSGEQPYAVAAGSDGNVWFTEASGHGIGKITPSGQVTEYPLPYGSMVFSDIVAGPDGALWFSEWFDGAHFNIGSITTAGTFTSHQTPLTSADIASMAFGADGALWMTQTSNNTAQIGKLAVDGTFTQFALPDGANPQGIASGPDGALWFTEYGAGNIGRITISGAVTHYPLSSALVGPSDITASPDGTLWITEESVNKIVQMNTNGMVVGEYAAPVNSGLRSLTNGPDGALWFTAPAANSVGRFNVSVAASLLLAPVNGTSVVGSTATFQASVLDTLNNPVTNTLVHFSVSGSIVTSGSCVTDSNGNCTYAYNGPQLPGADAISAYVDSNGNVQQDIGEPTASATQAWLLPTATSGQVTGGGHISSSSVHDIAFGFVARSGESGVSGECSLVDLTADVKLHCSDTTVVVTNGTSASIFGDATINGQATTYRMDIQDNGTPGVDNDRFSIVTASGYSTSGVLTSGNVIVK